MKTLDSHCARCGAYLRLIFYAFVGYEFERKLCCESDPSPSGVS